MAHRPPPSKEAHFSSRWQCRSDISAFFNASSNTSKKRSIHAADDAILLQAFVSSRHSPVRLRSSRARTTHQKREHPTLATTQIRNCSVMKAGVVNFAMSV